MNLDEFILIFLFFFFFDKMLIQAGVKFQTMYYPDRDHGISGNNARPHLYQLISDFIADQIR
jgi:dipeptidyl aminopeptidase/acylaminoacyl peptidase